MWEPDVTSIANKVGNINPRIGPEPEEMYFFRGNPNIVDFRNVPEPSGFDQMMGMQNNGCARPGFEK